MDLSKSTVFPKGPERKLKPEEEAELSRLYHGKKMRPKALQEHFGVCKATLYKIVARNPAEQESPPGDTGRA